MQGVVRERALEDTATAGAGVDGDCDAEGRYGDNAMRGFAAVAAHAVGRAVEYAHLGGVFPVDGPVPVRLATLIAAFLAERFLIEPGEVAMPVKKDALFNAGCQERTDGLM